MPDDLRLRYDESMRRMAAEMFAGGARPPFGGDPSGAAADDREKMASSIRRARPRRVVGHGKEEQELPLGAQGVGGQGRGGGRRAQGRGHGALWDSVAVPAGEMVQSLPGGRRRGPEAEAQGQAARVGRESGSQNARAGARGARPEARGRERLLKKLAALGAEKRLRAGRGPR